MSILSRYIFKEILTYFLICVVTFTSLILSARILKFTDLIVNKGVEASQIIKVFLAIIPTFLEIALPMSVLLGVLLAFARLSGDSEIVVIRASGVKITQLLPPVLIFGMLVVIFAHYLSFDLRPWGYRTLNNTLYEIAKSRTVAGIDSGQFNKLGDITLYAEEIDYASGDLKNVIIDDQRNQDLQTTIFSATGKISSDNVNQNIILDLSKGTIHEQVANTYEVTKFQDNRLVLKLDEIYGDTSLKKDKKGRELLYNDILTEQRTIGQLLAGLPVTSDPTQKKDLLKRFNRLKLELSGRFASPWICLIMALMAIPLGIMPPRTQKTWGASFSLAVGLSCFVLYFILLTVGMSLGEGGKIDSRMAVWTPNVIIAVIAAYSLHKINNESWSSVADVIDAILKPFKSTFRKLASFRTGG